MNYKELHLEAIMIPDNIEGLLAQDSMWDIEVPPFSISVVETEYKGEPTLTWSVEFSPAFDFEDLNERLETKGFESDGHGWTAYIQECLSKRYKNYADKIKEDSDSETCCLYTFNKSNFNTLLSIVSESIRELYN
jgi:hypothetical protein